LEQKEMNEILARRTKIFEELSEDVLGLDFFPIMWEVVPEEVMLEVMSYGLPTRARHWSYGQSYQYQKSQGEMGMSKVYELVLNNNPSYAFLLDSNSNIANTMVIAHVIGHVHFFKNNYLFKKTNRKMIYQAAERASRVEEYITQYGIEEVEKTMNIALSMEKNINWKKGLNRAPYGPRKKIWEERKVQEFDDLFGLSKEPQVRQKIVNGTFPPRPEEDLLWFFANYAKLEPWQKDIFEIIREESFYFYPQYYTKIVNEGFASFIHAELMYMLSEDELTPSEYLEFVKIHERVVQPGSNKMNINPYFLGFTILNDVRNKWDKLHAEGKSEINGLQKILEIVQEEDDISFLRNYLTQEIVDKLQMFVYKEGYNSHRDRFIQIRSTDRDDVIEYIAKDIYNYRTPVIAIESASAMGIELVHSSGDVGTLDPKHLERVLGFIHDIWPGIVNLETVDSQGESIHFTYDELGLSIQDNDSDEKFGVSFKK
jgi:stage V sporulation protein R